MTTDGTDPTAETVVIHDEFYYTKWHGETETSTVKPGYWVVWMRKDHLTGDTGCTGAGTMAGGTLRELYNDYVNAPGSPEHDDTDNPNVLYKDHGGLVRLGDIDGDGVDDIYSDLELTSDGDGRHDTDPFSDDDDDTIVGPEADTSTYYLCLAEYDKPVSEGGNDNVPYTFDNPPTLDSQFKLYEYVKVHAMHLPPSAPPPSAPPPPPSPPPAPPPDVFITVDGTVPGVEEAILHNHTYRVQITGGNVKPGDWIAFLRTDSYDEGQQSCDGAALAASAYAE